MPLTFTVLLIGAVVVLVRHLMLTSKPVQADRTAKTRRVVEDIKARMEFALLFVPATETGLSRLGGEPDMVPGGVWPVGPEGELGFVGQLDLAAARQAGGPEWLPATGLLQFFHDERWGEADQVRVLFSEGERFRTPPPPSVPDYWRYEELAVAFDRRPSLPSLEWMGIHPREVAPSGPAWAELAEIAGDRPKPEALHQLGGYPDEIQPECLPNSAEFAPLKGTRRSKSPWRLLLQIDTDDRTGMAWQDGGRVYILIRDADARAADFSRTVTITHTY
jgi:uncharacterized protein YwqG